MLVQTTNLKTWETKLQNWLQNGTESLKCLQFHMSCVNEVQFTTICPVRQFTTQPPGGNTTRNSNKCSTLHLSDINHSYYESEWVSECLRWIDAVTPSHRRFFLFVFCMDREICIRYGVYFLTTRIATWCLFGLCVYCMSACTVCLHTFIDNQS